MLPVKTLIGIILFGMIVFSVRSSFIVVLDKKNGENINAPYKILEEDFNHPRLQLLRKRENLHAVTSAGKTQFEKILLLRRWTRQQWESGGAFYYPPWDAVEILDLARKYHNNGFCAQYAMVFLQACLSMGIHARYVNLPGHFVASIWSDEYDKWVVMDPCFDMHFEKNGIPLSSRQLCKAYWSSEIKGIYKVSSFQTKTPVTKNDLYCYRMYEIILRNNHLSVPITIKNNGVWKELSRNTDYRTYPKMGRDYLTIVDDILLFKADSTTDIFGNKEYKVEPDDFRCDEDQTIIYFAGAKKDKAVLSVIFKANNSPTFKTFLVNVNNTEWHESPDKMTWKLRPGFNTLSVRIMTTFGWQCKESHIRIFYKPCLI
jgi:hypothetical protein